MTDLVPGAPAEPSTHVFQAPTGTRDVLPGVRVADGVVIGAGAVVHGDVEAAGVYAGVPARKLK